MSDESVTQWIAKLKDGDDHAAEQIWQRYFDKLVRYATKRLSGAPRRMADEEDVVLSAFDSFCRNATAGRFPLLNDRDGLWKLLFAITERKVLDQVKFDNRQKRGGGKVRGESEFLLANDSTAQNFGDDVAGREPTPEFAAQVAEQVQQLLDDLKEQPLRDVALMKMEGFNNEEIAVKLDCSPRSVTRRLKVIRTIWSERLL